MALSPSVIEFCVVLEACALGIFRVVAPVEEVGERDRSSSPESGSASARGVLRLIEFVPFISAERVSRTSMLDDGDSSSRFEGGACSKSELFQDAIYFDQGLLMGVSLGL